MQPFEMTPARRETIAKLVRDPDLDRIDEDHADTRRGRLVRAGRMQLLHGGRSFLRRALVTGQPDPEPA